MALTVFAVSPLGAALERADTSAAFTLGTFATDNLGGVWEYVQANGAVAVYDAVKVDEDGQAAPITTTISGSEPTAVGIAQVALADNEYGFVFRGRGGGTGTGVKVNVLVSCAADVKLYTTATAGKLDDTATTPPTRSEQSCEREKSYNNRR
jgi:hypothetical protein